MLLDPCGVLVLRLHCNFLYLSMHTREQICSSDLFVGHNAWNEENPFAIQVRHFSIEDRRERERRRQRDKQHTPTRRTTIGFVDDLLGVAPYLVWKPAEKPRRGGLDGKVNTAMSRKRSTLDAMDAGQAAYLRKVYMYTGSTIGVASIGAFGGMLFPISPIVPVCYRWFR